MSGQQPTRPAARPTMVPQASAPSKRAEDETRKTEVAEELVTVYGVRRLVDEHGRYISGWVPFEAKVPVSLIEARVTAVGGAEAKALACAWVEARMHDGRG